jgi:hypothetical protein
VVNPQTNSGPVARQKPAGRQPLLWTALAFAAGIVTGVHAWRPPLWWVVAWIVFALSGAYLLRRGAHNTYGHPRREVLDRLEEAPVLTYRTDLESAITFYLDGKTVTPSLPFAPALAEVH